MISAKRVHALCVLYLLLPGDSIIAQSICEEFLRDTLVQRVVFTAQTGSPFRRYGVQDQAHRTWHSFSFCGTDILSAFLRPRSRANVYWVPAAGAVMESTGPLNGNYIMERWKYRAVFTFERGYLVRITTVTGNAVEIIDFEIINTCGLPILQMSTILKLGGPFFPERDVDIATLLPNGLGEWQRQSSVSPQFIKNKLYGL